MPGGHAQWLPRTGSRGGERRRSPGPPGAVGGPATHGCEIGLCARGWLRANGLPRARSPGFRVTPGTSQRVCGRRGSEGRPNQWRRSSGSTAEGSRRCRRRRDRSRSASLHGVFRGLDPPKSSFGQCSRTHKSCPRAATLAKPTRESVLESKPCSKGANWGAEMIDMIGNPTLR